MDISAEFQKEYGEELYERIFSNIYGDSNDVDIRVYKEFADRENLNSYGTVHIELPGFELVVEFRDGNWNGSEILSYEVH